MNRPAAEPSEGDTAAADHVLRALQEDFPQFHISHENMHGRHRYVARTARLSQNPHTVITEDPGELRAALSGL